MAVVRCRGCGGLNNYAGVRPGKVARCGVCRVALEVSGKSQGVRAEELDRTVEGSPVPVIALVWDPADPTCRTAAAALERVSVQNLGSFVALTVDVEVHPGFAPARSVEALPTFLLFRGQQEVGRTSGVLAEDTIARWVLDGLAPATVH
jgi:thioredoxin-like negative regulator of GroEL